MHDAKRFQLRFGPYRAPQFEYGDVVMDSVRGESIIVKLSDGKIPWPIGKRGRARTLVVYADLERAIRQESNQAVCHWWGVTPQTVSLWRKALGVDATTAGTSALRRDHITKARKKVMNAAAAAVARNPDRVEKIRQSKLGKKRPAAHMEPARLASIGRKWTDEMRRKRRENQKRKQAHK